MKKLVFLTGTRADFGKLKSLIQITQNSPEFEVHIFATGMHLNMYYGYTIDEIYKAGFNNIYEFKNHENIDRMDLSLANTIIGFSEFIKIIQPDLIIVHGDRVEALAGAISGSINNFLVAHIEGGEISGTIDEIIRHSVSKMSHIHLVANKEAKNRLVQLGEYKKSIHVLGSPDLDLMDLENLPNIEIVKKYYDIDFNSFSIAMFHPVTTEINDIHKNVKNFSEALVESNDNFIIIYPNNDLGSEIILTELKKLTNNKNIKIYPSLRFEYFLRLLSDCEYIIGNSSSGIREAPYYNTPTVDVGTRQLGRANSSSIINSSYKKKDILKAIKKAKNYNNETQKTEKFYFGKGRSDNVFYKLLLTDKIWNVKPQKQFQEIKYND